MIQITIDQRRGMWEWAVITPVLTLNGSALNRSDAAKAATNMAYRLMTREG